MTSHQCKCDGPGQCHLFNRKMNARQHQICSGRTDPALPPVSEVARAAYVARWSADAGLFVPADQVRVKKPKRPKGGPGTELKKLIESLGLSPQEGCGCSALAHEMDRLGPDGCEEHRDRVIDRLRESQGKLSWGETLRAGKMALFSGLVLKISPIDPAPGLFDEAVRRARAALQTTPPPGDR